MKTSTLLMALLLLTAQPALAVPLPEEGMTATGAQESGMPRTAQKGKNDDEEFGNSAAVGCASGAAVGSLTLTPGLGTIVGCGIGALIAWLW